MTVWTFLQDHGLELLFGGTSVITALVAIHYARRALLPTAKQVADAFTGRSIRLFLSREAMIDSLLKQYDEARLGEEIWAQTVGMRNYPGDISARILAAASRGITFRYLVNGHSPALQEFTDLFRVVRSAQIRMLYDNTLRVQGVGDRSVIVAFPTMTTYTAIEFNDPALVKVLHAWFNERWNASGTSQVSENEPNP